VLWTQLAAERPRSRTTRLSLDLAQSRVAELLSAKTVPTSVFADTDPPAEQDWLVRARVRFRHDLRVGGVGTPRTVRQGEEMVMVMHGRAGAAVHLDSWSTEEPPLQAVLCDSDHVQVLDLLDEISPWPGSDVELVTKEMRAEEYGVE
jgi:hypothetical protein